MSSKILQVDTIIHAKYLVPVIPRNKVLEDHCLALKDGKILDIQPSDEIDNLYTSSSVFELNEQVLMPGLINSHGHISMSLFRGIADDLPLMDWLNNHIWPAEAKWVSEEFVRDGSELAIAEMIKSGTTCFSDMYFFPDVTAEVAIKCNIRAQLFCPILDFPTVWGSGPDNYIEKANTLIDNYKDHPLIGIGYGPHAPYTVSDEPLLKIKTQAIENDAAVQIHLHETQAEVDEAVKNNGKRPIARLNDIGFLSDEFLLQCVHMTALTEEDRKFINKPSIHVIHCPESNLKLASGFCEADTLVESRINLALGTDGAASNNDLDMFGEMKTAALIAKPVAQNASALDAMTAIELATINGAKALNKEDMLGSLEIGKYADIIAIDIDRLNSQPNYNIISNIVYSTAASQVTHSWIAGKPVLQDKKLITVNEESVISKARDWQQRIIADTK